MSMGTQTQGITSQVADRATLCAEAVRGQHQREVSTNARSAPTRGLHQGEVWLGRNGMKQRKARKSRHGICSGVRPTSLGMSCRGIRLHRGAKRRAKMIYEVSSMPLLGGVFVLR